MTEQTVTIYSVNTVLCLLLAGHWLLSRALRPLAARTLGANYLLYACQSLLAVLALSDVWEPAQALRATLAMLLGPALYGYYLTLSRTTTPFSPVQLLHLLPATVVAALILGEHPGRIAIDGLIIASFFIYLILIARPLLRGASRFAHLGTHQRSAHRWLCILASLLLIGLVMEVAVYRDIARGIPPAQSPSLLLGAALFALFNGLTVLLALRRSPLLEWMHTLGEESLGRWGGPQLDEAQARDIFQRWESCVQQQSLYKLESGISLSQGGRKLGIPARQLSEAINRIHGSGFSQYLNACRVKEAQRLIAQHPNSPLTELMLEAGFSTKSHFNKEFSRLTGMTPSQYRQQLQQQGT